MVESIRRGVVVVVAGSLAYAGAAFAQPAPSDPPGRVGRLAFVSGKVSFHDDQESQWTQALVNSPLTTGDALWTEPNARSEVSIAGTRVRMDSATQLDLLAIDDSRTRLQIDQGRIDIKTFTYDTHQPYEIVTPRGIVTLQQQGDYYVEAGSTQDPTRLGVRQGAAQIQAPNGQVMAVRAGEMAEITGDSSSPQLHALQSAPPPMPTYWAERDRQVVYEQPPQYLSAELTGYEDLNYYGGWSNDPEYGQVWSPRSVPAGWEPYRTGRWSYVQPWGWTWVDEQPWGFAPYHYGRWAHRNDRWFWVPPERQQRPVYAPALVAFVGGVELSIALGNQSAAPVGWFPLGPREVYVPPYTTNRDYYRRINVAARVQEQMLNDRWERAQRREAITDAREHQMMNRRFATVVPAQAFRRSEPVARVALKVDPQKIAAAPVAPVAAPPAPTQSIRAPQAPANAQGNKAPGASAPGNTPQAQAQAQAQAHGNIAAAPTRFANMQALAKPSDKEAERPKAPGPNIASRPAANSNEPNAKPNLPTLAPRNPNAPPPAAPAQAEKPNAQQPGAQPNAQQKGPQNGERPTPPQANAPHANAPHANAPANQAQQPNAPAGQAKPGTPPAPPAAQQQQHPQPGPGQANLPPVRGPQGQRPDQPHQDQARPNEAHPSEPRKEPPRAPAQAQQPPHNEQARPAQAPPAPQAPAAQPPQRPATPPAAQPQREGRAIEPQHQAPAPQPQRQQAAPAPQPQQHAAPPAPPQQAHAPAPQPAPQPQRAAPAPQPQQQHAAPPQQAHAPAPAPQPQQHAAPPPQQHQQQAQQPAPQHQGGGQQKKDDDKK